MAGGPETSPKRLAIGRRGNNDRAVAAASGREECSATTACYDCRAGGFRSLRSATVPRFPRRASA